MFAGLGREVSPWTHGPAAAIDAGGQKHGPEIAGAISP